MGDTIEVSRDVFEPIIDLVKLGLSKSEKEALKNLAQDQAAAKVRYFSYNILDIRSKYKVNLKDFKSRIEEGAD